MADHARDLDRGHGRRDLTVRGNPLDFMHEDHLREREVCARIDALASAARPDPETASGIMGYLLDELPMHIADEDEDLFPLLRGRCRSEDEIGRALARLVDDHDHARRDTPGVLAILDRIATCGAPGSKEDRAALILFAAQVRRHLILENAIVLPFARLRLTAGDLETLRLRMMQRRGLDRVMETPDAE